MLYCLLKVHFLGYKCLLTFKLQGHPLIPVLPEVMQLVAEAHVHARSSGFQLESSQ